MPTTRNIEWDWAALLRASEREARRVVRDPHIADEAAQEAVIRAWRRRDACRRPEDPLPWLRQIARREAVRAADRAGRQDRLRERLPAANASSPSPDDTTAERVDVRRALARLPESDRDVLLARYAMDLTQSDVAASLHIAEGTAKVRLHRARRRLQASLTSSDASGS
jgi:RNA polymerase sigma-70 factor (ECF subfamily)